MWVYGCGSMGITRCARLPGTDLFLLTNLKSGDDTIAFVVGLPLHPETDNYGSSFASLLGRPTSFPYGYDVH